MTKNGIKLTAYSPFGNPGRPWKGTEKGKSIFSLKDAFEKVLKSAILKKPLFIDGKNNEVTSVLQHPKIAEIAAKHSKGAGHVLLRFQIQRGIIVLTKSVTPSRIASNLELFDFELDAADMEAIYGLNQGLRVCPLTWDKIPTHKDYPFKAEFPHLC